MHKLSKAGEAPAEPYWLPEAAGVRLKVKPWRPAAMILGRRAAVAVLKDGKTQADADEAFTIAVAQWAVVEWEGVGDEEGSPVAPFAEGIAALFVEAWGVFDAFDAAYVTPALLASAEKNVSSPAPGGGSAGAKATAPPARRVAKPARPKKTPPRPRTAPSPGK